MLEKMGWTRGGGLGSEGTGIVAPVIASSFVSRAGLGAAQGESTSSLRFRALLTMRIRRCDWDELQGAGTRIV